MKYKLFFLCALLPAFASANEDVFSGFAINMGVSHSATTADLQTPSGIGGALRFDGVGKQRIAPSIGLNYTFKLSDSVFFAVGGDYYIGKHDLFRLSLEVDDQGQAALKIKEKNHFALHVAPGYKISEKTMLYGKLAWHQSEVDISANVTGQETQASWGSRIHGLGYGLGLKAFFNNHAFIAAEVERINYRTADFFDANTAYGTTAANVYLGYRF